MDAAQQRDARGRLEGTVWALISGATFATSGVVARPLLETGWSAGAVVLLRVGIAALVLAPFALRAVRGSWGVLRTRARAVTLFGVFGVAALQWSYFNAVAHMSVGVAILVEHLGIPLVVLWTWFSTRRRPAAATVYGGLVAAVGLVLVLDVWSDGTHVSLTGIAWAGAAAVFMAVYFVLASRIDDGLEPVVVSTAGMVVGALTLGLAALVGVLPFHIGDPTVSMLGRDLPWWSLAVWLGVIAAAVAYLTGVRAARLLGSTLASFLGMSEVLCAFAFAALVLGEIPSAVQCLGAVAVLAGVSVVELGAAHGRRGTATSEASVAATDETSDAAFASDESDVGRGAAAYSGVSG